ncbi:hypothetical protein GCM10007385_26130 [Tateyamaria omphalii]|uniref:DUF2147 domain-containing protein n=1 Tax=Tateyamaria omphalii TaxID=299262 RepID=UPI001677835A|nr:DUF2147 domain-containing protein [Tateyamaria omphalii]GGX56219.1 hypothetical protein GCM10007385_26130 [Tateyamaria omphalii]
MKHLIAAACLAVAGAGVAAADPVHGTWKTETGETGGYLHVTIASCGSNVCGTIAKVFNSDNTSSEGKPIIWDMKSKGNGSYSGGKIWAPDVDKTYRSKMSLNGNALKVSGCVGPICRGQTWTRVN